MEKRFWMLSEQWLDLGITLMYSNPLLHSVVCCICLVGLGNKFDCFGWPKDPTPSILSHFLNVILLYSVVKDLRRT